MAGHQLLSLGGERRRLGIERRRLGLRQEGAHLDEHRIVDIGVPALAGAVDPGGGISVGSGPTPPSTPNATTAARTMARRSSPSPMAKAVSHPFVPETSGSANAWAWAAHRGCRVAGSRRVWSAATAAATTRPARASARVAWRITSAGCQPLSHSTAEQREQRPLRLPIDQHDLSGRQPVDSAGEVVLIAASCRRGGDVDEQPDPLAQREQRLVGAFAAPAPGTMPTAPAGPSGALLGAPLGLGGPPLPVVDAHAATVVRWSHRDADTGGPVTGGGSRRLSRLARRRDDASRCAQVGRGEVVADGRAAARWPASDGVCCDDARPYGHLMPGAPRTSPTASTPSPGPPWRSRSRPRCRWTRGISRDGREQGRLPPKRNPALSWSDGGGRARRRSGDLPLFRRTLCRLSYSTVRPRRRPTRPPPCERSRRDLNPRPPA